MKTLLCLALLLTSGCTHAVIRDPNTGVKVIDYYSTKDVFVHKTPTEFTINTSASAVIRERSEGLATVAGGVTKFLNPIPLQ